MFFAQWVERGIPTLAILLAIDNCLKAFDGRGTLPFASSFAQDFALRTHARKAAQAQGRDFRIYAVQGIAFLAQTLLGYFC